jgi:hypothetical protein
MIAVLLTVLHPTVIRIRNQDEGARLTRIPIGYAETCADVRTWIRAPETHFRTIE